ncbi:MAG: cobyrinate a,c-diamide synthase [Propioniciclava sp.]|uniref:cobyrinate a,c-diamide synthase n=1 Tax=Propioniciclava sp. TaxID=2038686 RepID=UPI0039E62FE4
MVELPRLVIAAPSSSTGKTTVTVGLMAALRERGLAVSPHKIGPDYIDPGFHALATGRPGRNLDPWLCSEELLVPLLLHGARDADIAVIEGVMGLFDGRIGARGFGSTAHVARLVSAPVVLVVNAASTSRTAAAVVAGMTSFDPGITVAGVILNRVGSPRHETEIRDALGEIGMPCLGVLPRVKDLSTPSRHLGLVPAQERDEAAALIAEASRLVAEHIDLDAVLDVARSAPALDAEPWSPNAVVVPVTRALDADLSPAPQPPITPASGSPAGVGTPAVRRPRIAVAGGRAFTFRYAETTELLEAAGCEVVTFDPVSAASLPEGTAGLYVGGGFPEVYAEDLAANAALRADVAQAVASGLPTVAECAGLLYLADTLDGRPMAGALPIEAAMRPRLTLGYYVATAPRDTLLARAGETVRTHEFHRTGVTPLPGATIEPAWSIGDEARPEGASADPAGLGTPTVHAAYQHLHWAGSPQFAQRFADAAAAFASRTAGKGWRPTSDPAAPARSHADSAVLDEAAFDLDHHGDRDAAPGLVDLAVNVHSPAPGWLIRAVMESASEWSHYPDPSATRTALAAHHGVSESCVLPTAGAAEASTLIARGLGATHAAVVHPQFTEGEAALRRAGVRVTRVLTRPEDGFALDPAAIPSDADLVLIGNPTNPTGALHAAALLRALVRPGRTVVVDEAFMDFVPGEPESLIGPDMTGLVVLRSATKLWGIPGLRAGYAVGDPALIARLATQQPPWSVSAPALAALITCASDAGRAHAAEVAAQTDHDRAALIEALALAGFPAAGHPRTPFVLVDASAAGPNVRQRLADQGFAVRRGETFPGLGPQWIRIAVRDTTTSHSLAETLAGLRA